MAKFNVEVELDCLDEYTTIDEEIINRVIKNAEDYLMKKTTEDIEKKLENAISKKLSSVNEKIDEIVDGYLDVICQSQIEKMMIPEKESSWSSEVTMVPISEFIGKRFEVFCTEKRYNSDFKLASYSSDKKFSALEKDIRSYLNDVLGQQVSDLVRNAQRNAEQEIVKSLEDTLKQNLAAETIKKMNIPQVLENLQNRALEIQD